MFQWVQKTASPEQGLLSQFGTNAFCLGNEVRCEQVGERLPQQLRVVTLRRLSAVLLELAIERRLTNPEKAGRRELVTGGFA